MRLHATRVTWLLAGVMVIAATLQPISAMALTAPKPGTRCSPIGKTVTVAKLRYKCIRVSGKLVWSKPTRVVLPKPVVTPTPTPSPTPTPTPTPVAPIPVISPTAAPTPPATVAAARYAFQSLLPNGLPVHWSSCAPITWTYFDEPSRPSGLDAVQKSLQLIANATGFAFTYVPPGSTPKPTWSIIGDPDAPATPARLQIMFGNERNIPTLTGDSWGNTALYWRGDTGEAQVAYVVVRPDVDYGKNDFGPLGMGLVILHELGHAMGLDHVTSTSDLMYPNLSDVAVTGFAAGDLYGLYKVSAAIGCRP